MTSAAAAQRLTEQIDRLAARRDLAILVITEEELNSFVQARLSADETLLGMGIWFTQGEVFISADPDILGRRRIVDAAFAVSAEQGRVMLDLQRAYCDGRPLPKWALSAFRAATKAALADAPLPIYVERVTLNEGRLLLRISDASP